MKNTILSNDNVLEVNIFMEKGDLEISISIIPRHQRKCIIMVEYFHDKWDCLHKILTIPTKKIPYKPLIKDEGVIGIVLYDSRISKQNE